MGEVMERAASWAIDHLLTPLSDLLLPHLWKAVNTVKEVPKDAQDLKAKFDGIQDIIHDADRRAEAEEGKTRDAIKAKVKQLMETSFRMEDIIDGFCEESQQQLGDGGCTALPCKIVDLVKTMPSRLHFSYMSQGVKSEIGGIKDGNIKIEDLHEVQLFIRNQKAMFDNLRLAPSFIKEEEVVGFQDPRAELIDRLVGGDSRLTVIPVVGMGGQGKTTLARKVFDKREVKDRFICHAWITVSEFDTAEELLKDMLQKLCENPPENVSTLDRASLILGVSNRLQNKYVVVFDEVWNETFWCELEAALIDNNNGSRIVITTRNKRVAMSCRGSSIGRTPPLVHPDLELQPLTLEKSLELFDRMAFGSDLDPHCPDNLKDMSFEIVKKCEGLPLAIVAIGGALARNNKDIVEWRRFSQNPSLELGSNPYCFPLTKILAFSFHDLPYYLKPCFLYFGMYPEDYEVECVRLIKQWVAEGFVKFKANRTPEEVAEQYLNELIQRSLVQVSSSTSDGKAERCRVHYMLRHMILKKIEDLCFCHFASEHKNWPKSGVIRRLTITSSSNNWMRRVESSNLRSLHAFSDEELPASFVRSILEKYKLLKVLYFEGAQYVPENLENLLLLRYSSFKNTR